MPNRMGYRRVPLEQRDIVLIKRDILSYFKSNPNAADSVEGITNFWLARTRVNYTQESVREALEQLINEGEVVASSNPSGTLIYSKKN
ncbi:hypothetical protein FLL45_20285 [Aliikangiella marina]|uniref:Uncharacterized protein n=1 Tax=Aliikangiella marina TaxID=1712262 RepID=A0A545T2Q0_9GAMM|nr:hypothetical protein [Aliikangiella marina]TQV71494.1 hypothetical protein FLL45_20285 [Aliikangiella marina]